MGTVRVWPESTCVECGERIPSGRTQVCSRGGWCSWHIPAAVRERMEEMHEALKGAQEELRLIRMKDTNAVYDPTIRIRIDAALAGKPVAP
jgi:hypothetical protein